jgi:hypothetical protein
MAFDRLTWFWCLFAEMEEFLLEIAGAALIMLVMFPVLLCMWNEEDNYLGCESRESPA